MMRSLWNNPWFIIPVLVFFNVGLALLLFVPYGDEILWFNAWRAEPWNTFFRFCTHLGEAPAFVAIGLAAMLWRYRFALLFVMGGLVITPVSFLMKKYIDVDRPITYFERRGQDDAVVMVPEVDLNTGQTSFPSGHTMAAFGMFGVLALAGGRQARVLSLACAGVAILVGTSRIFLVQHFLVDVLAGAFIGLMAATAVWALDRRFWAETRRLDRGLLHRKA